MDVKEYVEQPGGFMIFFELVFFFPFHTLAHNVAKVYATLTAVWDERFDTDMVILAKFTTGEDGKLRISFLKQFLDGFHLMKMTESLKANGFPAPGA